MVKIFISIVHIALAIGVIATILLQSGKSAGLSGAIAGGAETFFGKKKGMDAFLSKLSTGFAVGFLLTSLLLSTSLVD
ncbi:preprotein translocase subunit SecG [Phosphitispora fastidiosa]|uniref:preprotein translocase subunit SecG n=1 Tax=Phosphitispora fastidiosa TaxID=2837202 RepID=UPI001E546316